MATSSRVSNGRPAAWAIVLDSAKQQLRFPDGDPVHLTPTELRLLACLMEQDGRYVSAEELLTQVWGFPPETGGAEIVRSHVSNLRRKLRGAGADPQLIHSIPYRGYAFRPDGPSDS